MPDEGADLADAVPSPTDALLDGVYGDHPHANDGRHLDGGIAREHCHSIVQIACVENIHRPLSDNMTRYKKTGCQTQSHSSRNAGTGYKK